MSTNKRSTLPAVLQQYIESYEPKTPKKKQTPTKSTPRSQKSQKAENGPRGAGHHGDGDRNRRSKSPPRMLMSRERTMVDSEKRKQHARKTYDQWRDVQRTLKDEDTELLKRKIHLQLQLIKQQQALAQYNRQQEEELQKQKREEARKEKREIAEALLRTCRESLECDRQKKIKHKKPKDETAKPQTPKDESMPKSRHSSLSREMSRDDESRDDSSTIVTAASPTKMRVTYDGMVAKEPTGLEDTPASTKPASPVSRDVTQMRDYAREYTGVSTLAEMDEEDEEEEQREVDEDDEFGDIPWHHIQLYKLYGKTRADSFLYPKIDTEKKRSNKPLDPKFQAEGGGRLSAHELWGILRGESQGKLLKEDAAIPGELKKAIRVYTKKFTKRRKSAYDCFAREGVSKRKPAVSRNFHKENKEEEWAMERIQDHSRVVGAQNSRHQLELMFRSSHMNEDRAHVLQFNNPIPDLNNLQGAESVARYMPSWFEFDEGEESIARGMPSGFNFDEDAESEQSYKKWIHGTDAQEASQALGELSLKDQALSARKKKLTAITESGDSSKEPEATRSHEPTLPSGAAGLSAVSESRGEWDFLLSRRQTEPQDAQPKYIFLTEKKARTPGQFSKRRQELQEAKNKPKGYEMPPQMLHEKAASAMGQLENNGSFVESMSFSLSERTSERAQSAYVQPPVVLWPPLSMTAVQEYKPERQAPGGGDYSHGKVPVWPNTQVAAT